MMFSIHGACVLLTDLEQKWINPCQRATFIARSGEMGAYHRWVQQHLERAPVIAGACNPFLLDQTGISTCMHNTWL